MTELDAVWRALSAWATVTELLQETLEQHHGSGEGSAARCPVCSPMQVRVNQALEQARAALDEVKREIHA